ncbi:MAG: hypothetical protein NXI31_09625 [bacterium]|nr:hypothetical protein [bacterium]
MLQHLANLVAATTIAGTLCAQSEIAHFSFQNDDLTSTQPDFATVSDLNVSNSYMFAGPSADRSLCLTGGWRFNGGTLSFTVTPDASTSIDYTELLWDPDNGSSSDPTVDAATVRANGNVIATLNSLQDESYEILDLTGIAALQGNDSPVTFEIEFHGASGRDPYEIGRIVLSGGVCAPNVELGRFDFENDDLTTAQPSFANVSDLQVDNSYMFGGPSGNRSLCLTRAWRRDGGTLSFTVTPNANTAINYTELLWDPDHDSHADLVVDGATVRANGVVVAVINTLNLNSYQIIDLSAVAALQGNSDPVTFEIEFDGAHGYDIFEIDRIILTGGCCVPEITSIHPTELPQLTNDCFFFNGDCLDTVQAVKFNGTSIPGGSGPYPGAYGDPFYTIMGPNQIKVCPPQCLPVGTNEVRFVFPNGEIVRNVDTTLNNTVTVLCQPQHQVGTEQCVFISSGPQPGPNNLFLGLSNSNSPSVLTGIVDMGIGDQFTNLLCLNAPPGECVKLCIGVIHPAAVGTSSYFQAVAWNFGNTILPLPISPVCESQYVN